MSRMVDDFLWSKILETGRQRQAAALQYEGPNICG